MTDNSNMTDKNKNAPNASIDLPVNEKSTPAVTSFEDLEETENDSTAPLDAEPVFEAPMSLAEEERESMVDMDDGFEMPDLENSFASEADLDDTPAEDPFDLPELEVLTEESVLAAPKKVEIISNPAFDSERQKSADPFPLPDLLAVHATALEEPAVVDEIAVESAGPKIETASLELDEADEINETDISLDLTDVEEPLATGVERSEGAFAGIELDLADDFEDDFDDLDELPDLAIGLSDGASSESGIDAKFFKDTLNLGVGDLYSNVLKTLYECEDIGIDATAKARVGQSLKLQKLPQMVCRDLVVQKIVSPVQLARAIARTQKRKEITSFLNIPHESMSLRQSLDSRVCGLLREARVIPLWHKIVTEEDDIQGTSELHLAHEAPTKNLVLEAAISELLPEHKFVWHFALRDVCGAYWLSGEDEDVDSNMEADALLDRIVGNAIDARSSDIHIDPSIKGDFKAMVRYRIDGYVQSKEVITLDQLQRLRIRIENIARMPKVDLHHPNKGAFTRSGYDWRIQIQPHAGRQGPLPRIVIRRLNPDVMTMEELGYPDYFTQYVKEAAKSPNGVILWTGPTGSGKTESIHSAIVSANPMGRGLSVHTIEDPPEKRVAGYAVQMEVSERDSSRSGMALLKSSLRADPDVIVFGEVRDTEMAGLVFEAANTGHLVFSTLHTNTSLDAIVRLDELGIFGFNISYVRGIAAQRLVRRLCTHCKQPVQELDEYTQYVFDKFGVDPEGAKLFTHDSNGCPSCNYSGYHGRIAIAEWLAPTKEIVNLSVERNYTQLEETALRAGWKPMGYMGVLHLKNGITDIHELSSKVQELAGDI